MVSPNSLACPVLPVEPQNLLWGIHLCLAKQVSRYFTATLSVMPLIADAVLNVFLKLVLTSVQAALTANGHYKIVCLHFPLTAGSREYFFGIVSTWSFLKWICSLISHVPEN